MSTREALLNNYFEINTLRLLEWTGDGLTRGYLPSIWGVVYFQKIFGEEEREEDVDDDGGD